MITRMVFKKEYIQKLARESADQHFKMKHEGDWYAHYYGFIYGFQVAEEKCFNKYALDEEENSK